jgi:SOS-response transcriptional repressor LexA
MPTIDTVAALAPVLNIPPETLAWGRNRRRALTKALAMPVRGEVAAGLWLEIEGSDEAEFEGYAVPYHPDYPTEGQYGLIVRGTSINKEAQNGDILLCLDVGISGIEVRENDLVIVERRRAQAGVKEVTAKLYRKRGAIIELLPHSDDPRWKDPIVLDPRKAPDGEEVAIIAVVIGTYRSRRRR